MMSSKACAAPFIISLVAGRQSFGMCGFSLMVFRMCLKINLGVFMYLFLSLPFSHPQQTVQMLCLPPLKQGERIIWPLGGFQVRCLLGFSWSFQDLLELLGTGGMGAACCHPSWSGILTFLCLKLDASLVTLSPFSWSF